MFNCYTWFGSLHRFGPFLAAAFMTWTGLPVFGQVTYQKLFDFGNPDQFTTGANPFGRLAQGRDGAIYGTTTSYQITGSPPGVIFKLNTEPAQFTE